MQFRKGLKKLGLFFSEQDASDLFQFGDSDGNGTLDFDEFGKVLSVLV
jgi:Ca2+-binding EF-hand superfamily protein